MAAGVARCTGAEHRHRDHRRRRARWRYAEKPVGLVWIAVDLDGAVRTHGSRFIGDRAEIRSDRRRQRSTSSGAWSCAAAMPTKPVIAVDAAASADQGTPVAPSHGPPSDRCASRLHAARDPKTFHRTEQRSMSHTNRNPDPSDSDDDAFDRTARGQRRGRGDDDGLRPSRLQ